MQRKRVTVQGIPKLDDAKQAGGPHAKKCTLILTEGDSAKSLAIAGLSVLDRSYYGVFPLRGKPLNVREANTSMIVKNEEIKNIASALGLKLGTSVASIDELRYGSVMIMADQDEDGSHIKALIVNIFHYLWPALLKIPGFLSEFITPIIKVTKGKQQASFFTIPEYQKWKAAHEGEPDWKIKYYKGLGTNTSKEGKEYFANLDAHKIAFVWKEGDDDAIEKAFSKKRADDRRDWILNYREGDCVDTSVKELSFTDLIDKELVRFSIADCKRSLPSMVDGLKPGQRKVLYSCIKRLKEKRRNKEIKVAQLGGYISEVACYHHGEISLGKTVVGMAQNYVGSNNVNLLDPLGCFGTRLEGGKDNASERYIFTRLSDVTRSIFRAEDDALLNYLDEDGISVEPEYYVPIIPMVLVNGAEGIGTGWSTNVPCYDPRDIVQNIKRMLRGEELMEMTPFYAGFKGTVTPAAEGKYIMKGVWNKPDIHTLVITELPALFGMDRLRNALGALDDHVESFEDKSTDRKVDFTIKLTQQGSLLSEQEIERLFKLSTSVSVVNMMLHDAQGILRKYSVNEILKEFYEVRLRFYAKRKQQMVEQHEKEFARLSSKLRFLLMVAENHLRIHNREDSEIINDLEREGFPKLTLLEGVPSVLDYEYLLSLPLRGLTKGALEQFTEEVEKNKQEMERVVAVNEEQMWAEELDQLLAGLAKLEAYQTPSPLTKEGCNSVTIHLHFGDPEQQKRISLLVGKDTYAKLCQFVASDILREEKGKEKLAFKLHKGGPGEGHQPAVSVIDSEGKMQEAITQMLHGASSDDSSSLHLSF